MTRKTISLIIIVLPLVGLLGWALVEQIQVWSTPDPRWVLSEKDAQSFVACSQLEQYGLPGTQEVAQVPAGALSRARAETGVQMFFLHRYGFAPLMQGDPQLVTATFPDGQPRLAWRSVVLTDVSGFGSMDGHASMLMLDGYNGAPLLLVDRLYFGDPCMTCGCIVMNMPVTMNQFWALALALAWAAGVGVVAGIVALFKAFSFFAPLWFISLIIEV